MRTPSTAVLLAALILSAPGAWGAPCATACKDEIRTCASERCQGLRPGPRMRCKRKACSSPIVKSCYADLAVCGATRARPKPPPVTGPMPYPY